MELNSKKRLVVEIDEITHRHIKRVIIDNNSSMRKWIMEAIADKIKKDANLGF